MRPIAGAAVAAVIVVAGLGGYLIATGAMSPGSSQTRSQTTVTVTASSTETATAAFNGSSYYSDNVTGIMITENPGAFHFDNGSVTFMGVEFQTICTDYGAGCPVPAPPPGTTFVVPSGASITLNVTFPDHSSEIVEGGPLFAGPVRSDTFSHHIDPQAGIMIVYNDSDPIYKSYLLVSIPEPTPSQATNSSTSGDAGTSSNTSVATSTATETLTTQASQATTSYAAPTSDCTLLGGTVTVTTTVTAFAPPATSTVTVTTTTVSTSYTQTVTVTSCTYTEPTVTSTVTTTASP